MNNGGGKSKDDTDLLEPVIDENGETKWLIIKSELVSNTSSGTPVNQVMEENNPLEKKPVFKLLDQSLWMCNKCTAIFQSNPEKPTVCLDEPDGCGRVATFKPITERIETRLWQIPEWMKIDDLDMKETYNEILELMKKLVIFNDEIYYKILSLWGISTWKGECWDSVAFPTFLAALRNSGKTTALMILYNIGYRMVESSGCTLSAIARLTTYEKCGILVDEAQSKLNPKYENGAQLSDFIKSSYKRGSKYVVSNKKDPEQKKVEVYDNYGPKAFAGEKSFDYGLLERAIVIWMDKGEPEIPKLSYAEDDFKRIRTKLLNYKYNFSDPPDLGQDFELKGRIRELYESIIATGKHIGINVEDIIKYAKKHEERKEDEIKDSVHYRILKIIKKSEENPNSTDAPDRITIKEIYDGLEFTSESQKEERKSCQYIGYKLRDLGLITKRAEGSSALYYRDETNEKRLPILYKRYHLVESGQKGVDDYI